MRMSAYLGFIEEAICQLSDYAPEYCESEVFYTPSWVANATFAPMSTDDGENTPVGLAATYTNETDSWNIQSPDAAYDFAQVTASNVAKADTNITADANATVTADTIASITTDTNTTLIALENVTDSQTDPFEYNTTNSTTTTISDITSFSPIDGNSTFLAFPSMAPSHVEGGAGAFVNETSPNRTGFISATDGGNAAAIAFGVVDALNATNGNETSFIIGENATIYNNETFADGNETSTVPSLTPSMFPTEHETFQTLPQVEASPGHRIEQDFALSFAVVSILWLR